MNSIEIKGIVIKNSEINIGEKTFNKFTVIDSPGKDKPGIFWDCVIWDNTDSIEKGTLVELKGYIRQREYNGKKYFNVTVTELKELAKYGKKEKAEEPAEAKPAEDGIPF
jgi:single-stranded DNA-binding protein